MRRKVNLYSRLLRYPQTADRSNLENYLTEMLCGLLNELSFDDAIKFVHQVLFREDNQGFFASWQQNIRPGMELNWDTQFPIGDRQPDLICWQSETPVLLVEAKIDAPFTLNQLLEYGRYLHEKNPEAALILLTKDTEPPEGFISTPAQPQGDQYEIAKRTCSRWHYVYQWLKDTFTEDHRLHVLAKNFLMFLEEKQVAFDGPTSTDFEALQTFVCGPASRITQTMYEIRKQLKKPYGCLQWGLEEQRLGQYKYLIHNNGSITSWVGLQPTLGYSFFEWGIIFPEVYVLPTLSKVTLNALPKTPYWFFWIITNDLQVFSLLQQKISIFNNEYIMNGFTISKDGSPVYIASKKLEDFLGYNLNSFDEVFHWLDEHFKRILRIL